MKLSQQEKQVITFLCSKREVYWEELVQFCKNPETVKLKTVKKIVSDIKKKYKEHNLESPFTCDFKSLLDDKTKSIKLNMNTVDFNGQKLIQIKRPTKPSILETLPVARVITNKIETQKEASKDFALNRFTRQVLTRSGHHALNDDDFEVFAYFHENKNRFITLEELRDKVCFPQYGSKMPPRWFSAIQRRVGNIRHQVPETKNRLLTAKQNNNSGYIFNCYEASN